MRYNIGVVGTGYVGLVTGTCFAESGNQVLCVDIDEEKVARLRQGEMPIYEPGLEFYLEKNIREGRLTFTTQLEEAVTTCPLLMLCLPTPPDEDGSADLSWVLACARDIATIVKEKGITDRRFVINKSTVPVGTASKVAELIKSIHPLAQIDVVSNPEFLREGYAVEDFMRPERVIVGTASEEAADVLCDLYEPFVRTGKSIHVMDQRSAEIAKYAANSFLATKISFMNDLTAFCENVGADIEQVRIAIGSDSRIGQRFLFAGIGFGGSCFPKDVRAILHTATEMGTELPVIAAAEKANHAQSDRFIERILNRWNGVVSGKRFALWGLAFKPNTDDVREAPAFKIIDALLGKGASVVAFDPAARENTEKKYGDRIEYADSIYKCVEGSDALVIATEWSEFRKPDFNAIVQSMNKPIIFDGRNLYDPVTMKSNGFEYHCIGRGHVEPLNVG